MEDDPGMRKLAEFIFEKQSFHTTQMSGANLSIPACLLTENFLLSVDEVLDKKTHIIRNRWQKLIDTCYNKMFNSHEMYLRHILFACQGEHKYHQNIFESFISVCAVIMNLSVETFLKTKMDFCDLNTDIFMVFYQVAMKKKFLKEGGFQGLKEYIDGHEYLERNANDHFSTSGHSYKAEKIKKKTEKRVYVITFDADEIANDVTSFLLAQKLLSIPTVRFPLLLSKEELIKNLVACRRKYITEKAEVKINSMASLQSKFFGDILGHFEKTETAEARKKIVTLNLEPTENVRERCSITIADSKTNHAAEKKGDVIKCKDIIEAVTRFNNSVSSGHEKANIHLQKEAFEILEHLKDNIQSFIELLDKYDEE